MKGIDVITQAARMAGIVGAGESLQGSDPQDCLTILQDMMDSWQADRLLIYAVVSNTFPLTASKQTYTLGTGGDFNIPRPAKIERIGMVVPPNNYELPVSILTYEEWAGIVLKNVPSPIPLNCYPDYQNTVAGGIGPYMNLSFWVIPNAPCSAVIYSWQPITTWPDLATTDVQLPPAYAKAIKFNLAVDLCASFHMPTDPNVAAQALTTKATIQSINLPAPILRCEPMFGLRSGQGTYDWRTDTTVNRFGR